MLHLLDNISLFPLDKLLYLPVFYIPVFMPVNHLLIDQAISLALNQNWSEAVDVNLEILDSEPFHIPTLNRLAKAYKEAGDIEKSASTYKQVLQIDPYNNIAKKNLAQLKNYQAQVNSYPFQAITTDFIDEPGLTKTIPLIRLGNPLLLESLQPGQVVCLNCNSHLVCITTADNQHIGALTDDIAFYLRTYLQAGNTYSAVVKSSNSKAVLIFLREVSRCDEYKNTPSFID